MSLEPPIWIPSSRIPTVCRVLASLLVPACDKEIASSSSAWGDHRSRKMFPTRDDLAKCCDWRTHDTVDGDGLRSAERPATLTCAMSIYVSWFCLNVSSLAVVVVAEQRSRRASAIEDAFPNGHGASQPHSSPSPPINIHTSQRQRRQPLRNSAYPQCLHLPPQPTPPQRLPSLDYYLKTLFHRLLRA